MNYGLTIGIPGVEGCCMCPENWQLAFEPTYPPGSKAYIIPGSFPLTVPSANGGSTTVLVPIPFSALIVGIDHNNEGTQNPYGLNFDDDWIGTVKKLLPLIPGLRPGNPISLYCQTSYHAGEQQPENVASSHPFMWVVYGRRLLRESEWTDGLGMARVILESRIECGSLPDPETLWKLWGASHKLTEVYDRATRRLACDDQS